MGTVSGRVELFFFVLFNCSVGIITMPEPLNPMRQEFPGCLTFNLGGIDRKKDIHDSKAPKSTNLHDLENGHVDVLVYCGIEVFKDLPEDLIGRGVYWRVMCWTLLLFPAVIGRTFVANVTGLSFYPAQRET